MGVDIEKDCFPCKVVGSGGALLGSMYIFYETQKFQSKIGKIVGGSASLGMLLFYYSKCFLHMFLWYHSTSSCIQFIYLPLDFLMIKLRPLPKE